MLLLIGGVVDRRSIFRHFSGVVVAMIVSLGMSVRMITGSVVRLMVTLLGLMRVRIVIKSRAGDGAIESCCFCIFCRVVGRMGVDVVGTIVIVGFFVVVVIVIHFVCIYILT